jgi:hypothetical protein
VRDYILAESGKLGEGNENKDDKLGQFVGNGHARSLQPDSNRNPALNHTGNENPDRNADLTRVGNKNFCSLQISANDNSKQTPWQTKLSRSIPSIVRGFKIGVTKWARQNSEIYSVWQKSFHDRVIRDENELSRIREYIFANPVN